MLAKYVNDTKKKIENENDKILANSLTLQKKKSKTNQTKQLQKETSEYINCI
jgi:hypothetical protein